MSPPAAPAPAAAPAAADPPAAAPAAPAAPAADPPAADPPAAPDPDTGSLFEQPADPAPAGEPPADPPAEPHPESAWMPEKFHVLGADGKVDFEASARKLADSYKALEAHKGAPPPASPEEYTFTPLDAEGQPLEGFDVESFTGDPLFKAFAEGAHAVKMTQDQLQFVVNRYLQVAPQLLEADQVLSLQEAQAELATIWPDEPTMKRNLDNVLKAVQGFGAEAGDVPGSRERLLKRFARDPDFAAFAAQIGAEMAEDPGIHLDASNSDVNVEAMMKGEAYWNSQHPDHERVKTTVQTHFARKHGTKARR